MLDYYDDGPGDDMTGREGELTDVTESVYGCVVMMVIKVATLT